ncbi:site-2 protease family protein [Qipengyuania citrea]|jgi:Zn-dependent protease|uniref:Site-2 protease family protein n=2 Tax=Qipengyuania TaxID=1855416 RepID=A0ABY4U4Z8_9SPHN|nr:MULTISPECIES: site-2 protease family protein [Erythrobacteraceae]MAP68238.1 site-2 protease family protein [Erythrobacteraceae bacterium]MAQ66386.1 site-2 protease family protein [Sphingomonadaceae bacterium]MBL4896993.1 site-2 protease family protein [Erythrobacter sp.]MBV02144.1 site-2 protease family protein [Citromicrobium sp.]MEC7888718.1 site-2 protease family protein [Pseudomonadota bacterium]|tara:strand:- start:207 stop:899 length:693 start_codon:yes stop_codon:yes gene_type:complete
MTETILLAVILIPCLIIAIVFHEVAHGWTALALGDPTAKEQRRLSLNPIRHVDPIGTLLVPGALALFGGPIFGWAKPVPVRGDRLRDPRFGMVAVAAAGPATNLVLAFIGALVFGAVSGTIIASGGTPPDWLLSAGGMFILINVFLALFNLLPIPPFDGSHIVGGLLPPKWAANWQKLQSMGMLFFIILIAATWAFPNSGLIENTVLPPVLWLQERYFEIAEWMARGIAG